MNRSRLPLMRWFVKHEAPSWPLIPGIFVAGYGVSYTLYFAMTGRLLWSVLALVGAVFGGYIVWLSFAAITPWLDAKYPNTRRNRGTADERRNDGREATR